MGTAAAEYDGKYATQAPSYGTETRGSPTKSQVIISTRRIGYPEVVQPNILVAMTQTALDQHWKTLSRDATVIVDSDLVRAQPATLEKVIRVPATRLSEQILGSRNYANMVMLGALVRSTGSVSIDSARKAICATAPHGSVEANLKAFELGAKAVEDLNRSK